MASSEPEVAASPALSPTARPGDGSARGMKVALRVADGMDGASLRAVHDAALAALGLVELPDGSVDRAARAAKGRPER